MQPGSPEPDHATDALPSATPERLKKAPIRDHKDLIVWQKACELEVVCHRILDGLTGPSRSEAGSQIRRAARGVHAALAEGHALDGTRQFVKFVGYARGSVKELESHLLSLERLGLARGPRLDLALDLCVQVSKMLSGLRKSLLRRP